MKQLIVNLRSPRLFISCALLLLVLAISLDPAIAALTRHYTKHTIDIRLPLEAFDDAALPSFERIHAGRSISWTDQDIGTDESITRLYTQKTATSASGGPVEVLLHVAYYTDPRYQISHTPEVCFRQDGATIHEIRQMEVKVPGIGARNDTIRARLVRLQRPREHPIIDLYLFYSNGRAYDDRERLRLAIGMPGDKYIYFAKVEVGVVVTPEMTTDHAIEVAKQFMAEALPVLVNNHLPTREDVAR